MGEQYKSIKYPEQNHSELYPNVYRSFQYKKHQGGIIPITNKAARLNVMAGPERTLRTGKMMGNLNEFPTNRHNQFYKDWRGDNNQILKEQQKPPGFLKQFVDPILMVMDPSNYLTPSNSVDGKFRDYNARIVNLAYDSANMGENSIISRKNTPIQYYHDVIFTRTDNTDVGKTRLGLVNYANKLIDARPLEPPGLRNATVRFINQISEDSDMYRRSSVSEMKSHVFRFINNYTIDKDAIQKQIRINTIK